MNWLFVSRAELYGRFRDLEVIVQSKVSLNKKRTSQINDGTIKTGGSESEKRHRGMANHMEGLLATHFRDLGVNAEV